MARSSRDDEAFSSGGLEPRKGVLDEPSLENLARVGTTELV
jgi:hypothetical protein